jgi:hypothetical protein
MLEKIGHIKNPLTVIAMFAGIAEVSGAVALPFLKPEVQGTYVWFLMLFPFFLVGVFFIVLWRRHHVLYAPSDFQNEQLFADLFRPTKTELTPANAMQQVIVEEESVPRFSVVSGAGEDEKVVEDASAEASARLEEVEILEEQLDRIKRLRSNGDVLLRRIERRRLASIALSRLSNESGLLFAPNVELKSVPGVVFDGACLLPNSERVVQIYWFGKHTKVLPSINSYENVMKLYSGLDLHAKANFVFILVVLEEKTDAGRYFKSKMKMYAEAYPFKVEFVTYAISDLVNYDLIE